MTNRSMRMRLFLAISASVVLHLFFLSRFGLFPSSMHEVGQSLLQVTLTQSNTAVTESQVHPQKTLVAPLAESRRDDIVSERRKTTKRAITPTAQAPVGEAISGAGQTNPVTGQVESIRRDQPQVLAESLRKDGISLPGLSGPARQVDIEFETLVGRDGRQAGRVRHHYVSQDGRYYNVVVSPSAGDPHVESSSAAEWELAVSGNIEVQGLSPVFYSVRGEIPERLTSLKNASAGDGRAVSAKDGRMRDGLLDRQSLLYQFMFQPPSPLGGKIWLSDGRTHALYRYSMALHDVQADVALAGVRTIRLVIVPDGDEGSVEKLELWLAPDMRYLPVMARYVDGKGEVTELRATKLDFSE